MSRVGKNIWFTEIDDCSEICHLKALYRKNEGPFLKGPSFVVSIRFSVSF